MKVTITDKAKLFKHNCDNRIVKNIITVFIGLIFLCLYLQGKATALFLVNAAISIVIILICRLSIFSLKTILVNYVLVPIFYQGRYHYSIGILEISTLSLEILTINVIIFIYNFISLLFLINSNIVIYEKKVRKIKFKINALTAKFLCGLAIIFIIVYYPPSFLRFGNDDRFYHLLPGNFWNQFAVLLLLMCLPRLKKDAVVKLSYVFVCLWCFVNNERVDAFGLLICVLLYLFWDEVINRSLLFILGGLSVVLMIVIGVYRDGNEINGITDFVDKIVLQSTSADIGYILNLSVHYVDDYGFLYGQTYLNYFSELFGETTQLDASSILYEIYGHPGGIHVLAEPYMNFGYIGVALYAMLENLILFWILKSKGEYKTILYYFLLTYSFRYCWYGIAYIETGVIYLLPITWVFLRGNNLILKQKRPAMKSQAEIERKINPASQNVRRR